MLSLMAVLIYNVTVNISGDGCGLEASSSLLHHNPWFILLEYYRRERNIGLRCGATLINRKFGITAAHCVKKYKFTKLAARLGEYDTTKDIDCLGDVCADHVVLIDIAEVIVHPEYNGGREHDIALLRLAHEAPYTDFIRPICLPSGDLEPGITFAAVGFGEIPRLGYFSHTKKLIPLPYWTREDCQKAYDVPVPEKIICAGGEEGIDTCRGDSGGPLIWLRDKFELWGVLSGGNERCGVKGAPGLYTKVIDYLKWINAVVQYYDSSSLN